MSKPTAITNVDVLINQSAIGTSLTQALGTATGVDSQGGRNIQTFTWVLLSKPEGSSAVITSPSTSSPTLASIDTWGNYLVFLRVTDIYGSVSEADPTRAPSTALQTIRVQSAGLSLEKPAAGERAWTTSVHKVIDAVESLNTSYTAVAPVKRLAGTQASAQELDRLVAEEVLTGMHTHKGSDVTQASMANRGAVSLAYEPLSVSAPKVANQVRGAWHTRWEHLTGLGPRGSQATITFTGNPATHSSETLTLRSTDGTVVVYTAALASDYTRGNNDFQADESVANIAAKLKLAIDNEGGHGGKLTVADDSAGTLTITQTVPGAAGNTYLFSTLSNTTIVGFDNGGRSNILQGGGLEEEILASFTVADTNLTVNSIGVSALQARGSTNPTVVQFRLLTASEFKGLNTPHVESGTALSTTGTLLGDVTLTHTNISDVGKPLSAYADLGAVSCAQGSVIVARPTALLEATRPYIDLIVTDYTAITSGDTVTLNTRDETTAYVFASTVNTTWHAATSNNTTATNIAAWINNTASTYPGTEFVCSAPTLDTSVQNAATATVTVTDFTELNSTDSIELVSTSGVRATFSETSEWEATVSNNQTAANIATAINANANFTASAVSTNVVTITQSTVGSSGNTTITLVDTGSAGMSKTDFTGGVSATATVRVTVLNDYGARYGDATVTMATGGGITLGTSGSATTSTFSGGGHAGDDFTANALDIIVNWKKRY